MGRRYADHVVVRLASTAGAPGTFLWRGRLYLVREVLGHWRERRAWWTAPAARAVHGDGGEDLDGDARTSAVAAALGAEHEIWRVEASRGRDYGIGVFDLCCDLSGASVLDAGVLAGGVLEDGAWRLLRVND